MSEQLTHALEKVSEWWNWSGPRPEVPVTSIGVIVNELPSLIAKLATAQELLTHAQAVALIASIDAPLKHQRDSFAALASKFEEGARP